MIYAIVFLLGLGIGSFLNCVIYRLENKKSFLKGRSYCPNCKHILKWQDLIPVLSFLVLRGKCHYCKKKISWQYPVIELITGLLFVLILYNSGINLITLLFFIIWPLLIIVFIFDLRHFIIPDKIIYFSIIIALIYRFFQAFDFGFDFLINPVLSGLGAFGFFLAIVILTKGKGMGLGDVKLVLFMGLFLGFPDIFVAMFLAFSIGAIIGVGMILARKRTLKSEVPFGPFLVTGAFIAFFWADIIINWYFKLFSI